MSEFKGTKGKWFINQNRSNILLTNIESETHRICEVKHFGEPMLKGLIDSTQEEGLYNAKLISCAPEMLEMLEYCLKCFQSNNSGGNIAYLTEQLIKKATEV